MFGDSGAGVAEECGRADRWILLTGEAQPPT